MNEFVYFFHILLKCIEQVFDCSQIQNIIFNFNMLCNSLKSYMAVIKFKESNRFENACFHKEL